jgi:antitoxin component of RelBE/YafQ-DinJ toxin-antitoxin module
MKTAISIDEAVFRDAEGAAVEMGLTRSRLYTLAVEEYIRNHRNDAVTERLNQYYDSHKAVVDDDIKQAAYDLFSREDW